MIKFCYAITYVADVDAELAFFERAFGFKRKFATPEGDYGELDTGAATVAFANHSLGQSNLPAGYVAADASDKPLGVELGFIVEDLAQAHKQALECGAVELRAPHKTVWGQHVAWLRSPQGVLFELGTEIDY